MASGLTHDRITYAAAILTVAGGTYLGITLPVVMTIAASIAFGGVWLSPDLDLPKSRPSRRWGLVSFIWWPLRHFGHRSKLSHGWIVGSVIRLGWLLILLSPVIWILGVPTPMLPYLVWAALGVLIGGELHLLTDLLTTGDNDRYE